ncbi:dehydrogenase [Streptomyces pluripotens]|uniref:Dihydrolipoamide acetyltransferase component of pyruvate dehydrogenase complex n=2 Tax=Streptomyces TaxID=1883 RepID=A0A221P7Q1_9ACTN|nr:dehydrogenase [Streptomyces pluripotens]ASN28126.1 dehydrogenase [Streptomyces pluripotens]MCH0559248.1 2-oxo acid dehydrogenase subunit E2 [Streptomyces sp. MUM 16J]
MPSLGADMRAGTLQEWLVAPGDTVSRGDVIAVVETDKSAIEVECFESGTVGRLLVEPGAKVPVGTPLAVIEATEPAGGWERQSGGAVTAAETAGAESRATEGKAASAPVPAADRAAPVRRRPVAGGPPAARTSPLSRSTSDDRGPDDRDSGGQAVSPLVRHLAVERGVDLATVHGTGPGGRITRTDVERAEHAGPPRVRATPYARRLAVELGVDLAGLHGTGAAGAVRAADVRDAVRPPSVPVSGPRPAAAQPPPEIQLPSGARAGAASARRAIGELMSRSKREIPHYYLATTIDMAAATNWLRDRNRERPVGERLIPAALLLKAVASAARQVPDLNGFWEDGGFVQGRGVHLGFAVSLRGGGLAAPVIHDADALPPGELMAQLKDLVGRARRGRLRGTETTGSTLTVTSLGDQGVETVFGVIHPPQVALVGFGAVVERPWADHGMLGVRPVVTATLSADHRATDGAVGARFLTAVGRLLQKPEVL